jgi:hypothetical protein
MEYVPKLRMLVALYSNLFNYIEFAKSNKEAFILSKTIHESYEAASENQKKDHSYLKFLIVDKI